MRGFVLRRLIRGLVTVWVVVTIVFLLARLSGDPLDLMLPLESGGLNRAAVRQDLGLDQPLQVQYLAFLGNALHGDFGDSIHYRKPAMGLVMANLPNSITLAAVALLLALLLAFPLGVVAAVKKGQAVDQCARLIAILGITTPGFLVGILLIQLLSVNLMVLPTSGLRDWRSFIMPGFTLALAALASWTRLIRSSMLEVLDTDFIKLARLKGLPEQIVIWKHALRNCLIPVLTVGGMFLAQMITVAVVVETVFAWPGIGRLSYQAIVSHDFPIIQAVVIVASLIVVGSNLAVDVAYGFVDPRIRHR